MSRNPVQNATLPKEEHKECDIWTVETLFKALEVCDDNNLSLALNLAFSCSLRIGGMLGLTWDCIDISERSIKNDCVYIFVNKELQRANRNAQSCPAAEEVQEETKSETASQTDQEMLLKLLANPEMAALLKTLAKNL